MRLNDSWVYVNGKVVGPMAWWEIKIVHSKSKSVLIYHQTHGWVPYKIWKSLEDLSIGVKPSPPSSKELFIKQFWFFIVRKIFKNHHLDS